MQSTLVSFIEKVAVPVQIQYRSACLTRNGERLRSYIESFGRLEAAAWLVLKPHTLMHLCGDSSLRYVLLCSPCLVLLRGAVQLTVVVFV